MVLQTVDVAGFCRFGICDAVSIFLPAVSRLFPIFPVYVALFFWFISSRISSFVPVLTALLQWGNGIVATRGERC